MTLKDVAHVSGCSVATVSKVFKNSAEISEDTKQRVIKAARQIGYLKKATSKPAVLGGQRPLVFCDSRLKYLENVAAFNKLCDKYDFSLMYVVKNASKAKELALEIGAWGIVFAESTSEDIQNSLIFSGDESAFEEYLIRLSKFVPKRAPRTGANVQKTIQKRQSVKTKEEPKAKQEEIWLL